MEQRHSVTVAIGTPLTIPWVSRKGVTFVLEQDDGKVGELRVTGAHIHVRRANKKNWKSYTFAAFLDKLAKDRS